MSDRFGAITAYAIDETGLLCGEVVLWYSEVPTLLINIFPMNLFGTATWVLAITWGIAMMQVITYLQKRSKDS